MDQEVDAVITGDSVKEDYDCINEDGTDSHYAFLIIRSVHDTTSNDVPFQQEQTIAAAEETVPTQNKIMKWKKPRGKRAPRKYVPDELKDEAYFLKRKKNTEAARKCRNAKKLKNEPTLQTKLDLLAQQNEEVLKASLKIKAEHQKLKSEALFLGIDLENSSSDPLDVIRTN